MAVSTGSQLRSAATSASIVVVRGTEADGTLAAAGSELLPDAESNSSPSATPGDVLPVGKRFVDAESGLELLVVAPGAGPLTFADRELTVKDAKPLPASD